MAELTDEKCGNCGGENCVLFCGNEFTDYLCQKCGALPKQTEGMLRAFNWLDEHSSKEIAQALELKKRVEDKDLINLTVGKIMSITKGQVNPEIIQRCLIIYQQLLEGDKK